MVYRKANCIAEAEKAEDRMRKLMWDNAAACFGIG